MTGEVGQVRFYLTSDGAVKLEDATREQLIEWLVETSKERDRLVELHVELHGELCDLVDKYRSERLPYLVSGPGK